MCKFPPDFSLHIFHFSNGGYFSERDFFIRIFYLFRKTNIQYGRNEYKKELHIDRIGYGMIINSSQNNGKENGDEKIQKSEKQFKVA